MFFAQETSGQWDLRYEPSPLHFEEKMFVLVNVALVIATATKLALIWRHVLPFRRPLIVESASYRDRLPDSLIALKFWSVIPFLAWAFVALHCLRDILNYEIVNKVFWARGAAMDARDLTTYLSVAFFSYFLVLLARWHLSVRLDRYTRVPPSIGP